ncbi:hypothetical protein D3C80_1266130 [compost metagenome]
MPIIPPLPRPQRRHIHKIIHATRDKGHARRLMLHEGRSIADVHHLFVAARSTIGRWLRWYRDEGIDALEALPAGGAPVLPIAKLVTLLVSARCQRDKEKLILVYRHAGEVVPPLPTSQNHHADPR